MSKQTVATPSQAYNENRSKWQMVDDLCGGTTAMREAGELWLPREERETQKQYSNRLKRSILYGAFKDTIEQAVAKPFSKPITLSESPLPELLEGIESDVDRDGQSLTSFGAEAFRAALKYGLTHAIVDYPPAKTDEEGNPIRRSAKDERDENIHPYFVHVPPTALIGWRIRYDNEGRRIVEMARIKSDHTEPDGDWGEKKIHRVTVWTETEIIIFESETDKEEDYREVDRKSHSFGRVPLVTLYIDDARCMTPDLPFEDLGWLNVAHWQSMSDQRNILRIARVPFILAAGFTKEEIGDDIAISAARFIRAKNPDAKMSHVEHSGKAIEAGEKDLQRLEERMVILGLQPFIQTVGTQTATGKAIDQAQTHTQIQAWIRECEAWMRSLYAHAAEWIGKELPDDFGVSINNDFGFSMNAGQDIANLIKARMALEISRKTFLSELRRRGFISDTVDIEAELALIEESEPPVDVNDIPNEPDEPEETEDDAAIDQ